MGRGRLHIVFCSLTVDSDLHRRGCTRTAFEFAKLLYSLDPWTDPHGSLLHLDGLAVKAGMHDWLLDVWEYFETNQDGIPGRLTPIVLPGWWYTRALAMKIREDVTGLQASEITYPPARPLTPLKSRTTHRATRRSWQRYCVFLLSSHCLRTRWI